LRRAGSQAWVVRAGCGLVRVAPGGRRSRPCPTVRRWRSGSAPGR